MEQRTPEWHNARRGLVTASMVGAILGLSPYMTRAQALRRIVRDMHGAEPEFTGNIATEYGTRNEAGALVEFEMVTGHSVAPGSFHTRDDWAGASPDGLIGDDALVEIKCPFSKRAGAGDAGFLPLEDQPHYAAQVQFQLWVTGREVGHFFQWSPDAYRLESVPVDLEWQAVNLSRLRQFHAEVMAEDVEPHLAPLRAEIDTPVARKMMQEYDDLLDAIERAEERKKDLLAQMTEMAGDKSCIFAGRNLTKVERQGSVSYAKALAELAPGVNLDKWRGKATTFWQVK
jgi:putative phage-type endonuclease